MRGREAGVGAQDAALQHPVEVVEGRHGPVALRLAEHLVHAAAELQPPRRPPVRPPAVPDHPVLEARGRLAPAGHLHHVVDLVLGEDLVRDVHPFVLLHILAVVEHELIVRGERACDGPASVDLLHHRDLSGQVAIRADPVPGPILHREAALLPGVAIAAHGVRRAAHIPRLIRHAGLVRHLVLRQVPVDHPGIAALATGRWAAVRRGHAVGDDLPPEHHVGEPAPAHDLDAVVERGRRGVDPAGAAVDRDVLIPVGRDQVPAVGVPPVKVLGQVHLGHELLGARGSRDRRTGQPALRAVVAVVHSGGRSRQGQQPDEGRSRNHRYQLPG
mmetsp:Transcript_76933/g.243104  ORF Transcript_76933/g.243104 Transcript_76933/m.243104 type:complete len:330 (+) Transcript_76933:461-1450(+)